jgi:pyruvate/2-oxoglutarate dehydrogenase complex dihydrolipoamide acyltransferase (E2) component
VRTRMIVHVTLPKLGDTTTEVLIKQWLQSVGTRVDVGSPLVAVETDKVEVEVPSPVAGILIEQLVGPEEEVAVGEPICAVDA